ncbi:MAG: hypothetical protein ACFCBV_10800 [Phycisphaerales bacterium]
MLLKLVLRLLGDPIRYESTLSDAVGHDPTIESLDDLQNNGSYQALRRYLASETDSASRQLCIEVVARDTPRHEIITRWAQEHPDDPNAHVVAGLQAVRLAWRARSGARANDVRKDQWQGFAEYLYLAEEILEHALQLAPDEPMTHASLVVVDCGMGRSTDVAMGRMAKIRKVDPTHFYGYTNLLSMCCDKWCGSHEQMFQLARSPNLAKPGRENLGVLIPMAHLERTLFESVGASNAHWRQPEVATEIADSFDRGIGRPGFHGDALTPVAAGTFAGVFHRLKDRDRCHRAHQLVQGFYHDRSWFLLGSERGFKASRKWCGA